MLSGLKGVPTLQLDKIRKVVKEAEAVVKAAASVSAAQFQGVGALVTLLLTSQQPEVKRQAESALNNIKFEQVGMNIAP